MKIKYSPDAADRLRKIRQESGLRIAEKIVTAISLRTQESIDYWGE